MRGWGGGGGHVFRWTKLCEIPKRVLFFFVWLAAMAPLLSCSRDPQVAAFFTQWCMTILRKIVKLQLLELLHRIRLHLLYVGSIIVVSNAANDVIHDTSLRLETPICC